MPGKNKQQKNAFYFYMQELLPSLKREGRVFPRGMADVVPIAHPRYQALPEKEKERFENMAKEYKRRMRGQPGDAIRQDNQGNVVALRRDDVSDYETAREKEIKALARMWPQDITEEKYYFIDVQSLCKTADDQYLPVELALLEFSLKDGIINCYHQFLKPGRIPQGMRYECMSKSEDTHQIPVEGHADATNNYLSVQNCIENFINPEKRLPHYPPVFALREDWKKVDYTLSFIKNYSCLGPRAATIKVYELESLYVAMAEHSGKVRPPSKGTAFDVLTTTIHDYVGNIKCKFHEGLECKHCSLLTVRKYAFAIADAMTGCYDYELYPHTHLPAMKGPQFTVQTQKDLGWTDKQNDRFSNMSLNNSYASSEQSFKAPANMPKTQSMLAARLGQPAPIFRPPGASDLDHGRNKTTDIRYQQQAAWRSSTPQSAISPMHSHPSTRAPTPPLSDSSDDEPTEPSQNVDLSRGRAATWLPPSRSLGSWSRTTTPASTPRATPMATPMATPLATPLVTPRHSPPRSGAHFPSDFTQRHNSGAPPGFSVQAPTSQIPQGFQPGGVRIPPPSMIRAPGIPPGFGANITPPGLNRSPQSAKSSSPQAFTNVEAVHGSSIDSGVKQQAPAGWGTPQADTLSMEDNFPSLAIQPGRGVGRGRGSAWSQK